MMDKTRVSLSFDSVKYADANAISDLLGRFHFHCSFSISPTDLLAAVSGWKALLEKGHELVNGTLLSCALPDGSLPAFTRDALRFDVMETQSLFREVLGVERATLAMPIGEEKCADGEYVGHLAEFADVVRSGRIGLTSKADLTSPSVVPAGTRNRADLIQAVRLAISEQKHVCLVWQEPYREEEVVALLSYLDKSRDLTEVVTIRRLSSPEIQRAAQNKHLTE